MDLYDLNQALQVYKSTSKLALRRLLVVKTKQMLQQLDAFVREVCVYHIMSHHVILVTSGAGTAVQTGLLADREECCGRQ